MQSVTTDQSGITSHQFSASNLTAIYSVLFKAHLYLKHMLFKAHALKHICKQAAKLNIETPYITFDQPLQIKAFEISKSLQIDIVIRLGVFHLLMSFLEGIGSVIEGSRLKDGLESIYALAAVRLC